MIKISLENAQSHVASHNEASGSQEELDAWMGEVWDKLSEDNPYLLSVILAYIEKVKETGLPKKVKAIDAWTEGVLAGLAFTYKIIDRQYESEKFEQEFA